MSENKPIRTAEDWIEYIKRYKQRNGSRLPVAITVPTKDFLALVNDFKQVCDSNSRRRAKIVSTTTPIAGDGSVVKKHEAIAELKSEIKRKEGVGQRWFERCMEARGENVKLKRALWIARAERYKIREFIAREEGNLSSQMSWSRILRDRTYEQWVDQLLRIANLANKLQNKCRAKAEEYK